MRLSHIGRSNQDEIPKFKQGELNGMFYVHRSYHDPHEVVLDTRLLSSHTFGRSLEPPEDLCGVQHHFHRGV
jgi:hypothetical protein